MDGIESLSSRHHQGHNNFASAAVRLVPRAPGAGASPGGAATGAVIANDASISTTEERVSTAISDVQDDRQVVTMVKARSDSAATTETSNAGLFSSVRGGGQAITGRDGQSGVLGRRGSSGGRRMPYMVRKSLQV